MNSYFFVSSTIHNLNCMVYYPEIQKDLPLLVYLHGAGERGIPKLISEGREIPAVVLCPQCPATFIWNNVAEEVKDIVLEVRIYKDGVIVKYNISGTYTVKEEILRDKCTKK